MSISNCAQGIQLLLLFETMSLNFYVEKLDFNVLRIIFHTAYDHLIELPMLLSSVL